MSNESHEKEGLLKAAAIVLGATAGRIASAGKVGLAKTGLVKEAGRGGAGAVARQKKSRLPRKLKKANKKMAGLTHK
jgi:hypothetical protein